MARIAQHGVNEISALSKCGTTEKKKPKISKKRFQFQLKRLNSIWIMDDYLALKKQTNNVFNAFSVVHSIFLWNEIESSSCFFSFFVTVHSKQNLYESQLCMSRTR